MKNNLICAVCGGPVASANKPHMNCSPELREKIGEWLYIEKWGHSWDAENELYKESWRREADRLINFINF